jgi:hypothetical protein
MMAHRTRILPIAAVLAAGMLAVPAFAQTAGGTAPAATVPPATMAKAGHALHDVMAINRSYGSKVAQTSDPAGKQRLITEAKQQAEGAIARDGLTIAEYKQVLATAQQNPAVRQQLLSAAGLPAAQR